LEKLAKIYFDSFESFDFAGLQRGQELKHGGDLAFDSETVSFAAPRDEEENQPARKVINILGNKPKSSCALTEQP